VRVYSVCASVISYSYNTKMNMEDRVRHLELEMASHEAQCEERWKTTFNRLEDIDDALQRIENRLISGGAATLLFLVGLIIERLV